MATQKDQKAPLPAVSDWAPALALSWLIPGGGHFLLKKTGRGCSCCSSITTMFVCGLMMRGAMFHPARATFSPTLINTGGFLGDVCLRHPLPADRSAGYNQPDMAGAVHDYGTKFLVTAGLLNVLAMVDAFEIAARRKE